MNFHARLNAIRAALLMIGILLINFPLYSQHSETNPPFKQQAAPQAPNTATLGRFTDYPVSQFSGVPDISIPIYEVKTGNLSVPVAIRYHASGIKVTDISSWIGLGWALDAGGQISRSKKRYDDDYSSSGGYLAETIPSAVNIDPHDPDDKRYLDGVYKGERDLEPDIFSYSFPGGNGKFFFNKLNDNKPELIPFSPIKIQKTLEPIVPFGQATVFTITDKAGNIYKYKSQESSFVGTSGYNAMPGSTSAFMLDNIKSVDTINEIQFKYTDVNTNTKYYDIQDSWVVDDYIACPPCETATDIVSPYHVNPMASKNPSLIGVYNTEQALEEISFPNGKVVFERSAGFRQDQPEARALNNIKVYNYDYASQQYKLIKTVALFQSYFQQETDPASKRLRLDSIQVLNSLNTTTETYRFVYNNRTLPKTDSRERDFWGYYNGKHNDLLVPRQTITYVDGSESSGYINRTTIIGSGWPDGRDPDSVYNQACMLKRIYYPTGGFTDYNFETNQYIESGVTKLSGGLRVHSIVSYDGVNPNPTVKTYTYNSAIPNYILNNFYFVTTQTYYYYQSLSGPGFKDIVATKRVRTFMSSPSIDIVPYDQVIVAYPKVTEYLDNGSGTTGKTEYTFTYYGDFPAQSTPAKPSVVSNFYKRGLLSEKLVYQKSGSQNYQLLRKEHYEYFAFPQKQFLNVGFVVFRNVVFEGDKPEAGQLEMPVSYYSNIYDYGNYPIYSGDNYPVKKVVTEIDPVNTDTLITTFNYNYDNINHQQVTSTVTSNSKGEIRTDYIKYPLDYTITGSPANTDLQGIKNLQTKGVIDAIIEQYSKNSNVGEASAVSTNGYYLSYDPSSPHVKQVFQLVSNTPLYNFVPASIASGSMVKDAHYDLKVLFNKYDKFGNILEQQKKGNAKEVYLWGYKNQYPIAKIIGSSVAEVLNISSLDTAVLNNGTESARQVQLALIRNYFSSIPGVQVTTYTYQSLIGMTSETDPSGRTVFFRYDNAGRLNLVKDDNGNVIKKICYNYQGEQVPCSGATITYGNLAKSQTFRRNNCTGGYTGSPMTYTVPAGKYTSVISQADADQKAQNDIDVNGQNYVNTNAFCAFFNTTRSQTFTRNTCGVGYIGSSVTYTVAAETYNSTISQADADQMAQNEITTNGQDYANLHGTCAPEVVTYYNTGISPAFVRSNCGTGYTGTTVYYEVPEGKYTSTISQADADQKAQSEANANGQTYANANGQCLLNIIFNVRSSNSTTTGFTVTVNGVGAGGSFNQTAPPSSSIDVSATLASNTNATVVVYVLSGYMPVSAALTAGGITTNATIGTNSLTFTGVNISAPQTISLRFY